MAASQSGDAVSDGECAPDGDRNSGRQADRRAGGADALRCGKVSAGSGSEGEDCTIQQEQGSDCDQPTPLNSFGPDWTHGQTVPHPPSRKEASDAWGAVAAKNRLPLTSDKSRAILRHMIKPGSWRAAVGAGAIVAIVVLVLTGCSGSGFSVLDRDAGPGDALPAALPDSTSDNFLASSVRFAGTYRGDLLYAAKGAESASYGGESVCLLIYPEQSERWASGCARGFIRVSNGLRSYELRMDGATVPDGVVQVSPNVFMVEQRNLP
jgi:hypothetical protein